jgi:hypothetical protein
VDYRWAERTTWTTEDQADFHAHLKRARRVNRADYLIRQARALAESDWPNGNMIALDLLAAAAELGITNFRRPGFHQLQAQCLIRTERLDAGLTQYDAAFTAQRLVPNVRCGVHLEFAWLIAVRRIAERYPDAVERLEEFTDTSDLLWPINQYRYFGALALISDALGDRDGARRWAGDALAAAGRSESAFPRHPKLGLVDQPESGVYNELLRLAAA